MNVAKRLILTLACLACGRLTAEEAANGRLLLIVGAPGEQSFAEGFNKAADAWESLAEEARIATTRVDPSVEDPESRTRIQNWITELADSRFGPNWIVYLGHGTHSDAGTKLNLAGPDISLAELGEWLDPIETPLVLIHGGSASGPFVTRLSRPGRIVITATKSGEEQNYARFGEAFAKRIGDPKSDLDLDGQVSVLEAFVASSNAVETFYREAGRLATEHALLDDNGDKKGIAASAFQGLRLKVPDADADGQRARRVAFIPAADELDLTASQRQLRESLEAELEALKRQKSSLDESSYYQQLESIIARLSQIYVPPPEDS